MKNTIKVPSFNNCSAIVAFAEAPKSYVEGHRFENRGVVYGAALGVTARDATFLAKGAEGAKYETSFSINSPGFAGFSVSFTKPDGSMDYQSDQELREHCGVIALAAGMPLSKHQILIDSCKKTKSQVVFDGLSQRYCIVKPGMCGAYTEEYAMMHEMKKCTGFWDYVKLKRNLRRAVLRIAIAA